MFKANPLINVKDEGARRADKKRGEDCPFISALLEVQEACNLPSNRAVVYFNGKNNLRQKALEQIDKKSRMGSAMGRNRIYSMIENRPDWCISRQRSWGRAYYNSEDAVMQ